MFLKRLEPEDFTLITDSVTSTCWSENVTTLTSSSMYTSSIYVSSSYFLDVYNTDLNIVTNLSSSIPIPQFAITYGHKYGSGSQFYNDGAPDLSPSRTIYGQYRNLVLGNETSDFIFGNVTSSDDLYIITINRDRYKQALLPGSLTLALKGTIPGVGTLYLTDNSLVTPTIQFCDAGRIFQLVSGSAGAIDYSQHPNGYAATGESYGWLLPDTGLILLNPNVLPFITTRGYNTNNYNIQALYKAIVGGNNFTLNSQETISSNCIFVRAKSMDFNYSENPSFTSGSNAVLTFDSMREHPQTFPTTIGLYNDTNDLVAVAKVSKPILKDFTTEALIKVKLDF